MYKEVSFLKIVGGVQAKISLLYDTICNRIIEKWSVKELEIANIAWKIFKKIDKVAKLLKRQPSSVEKRLKNENLL